MALSRRTGQRFQASIWPGFVDAMTGLLLVPPHLDRYWRLQDGPDGAIRFLPVEELLILQGGYRDEHGEYGEGDYVRYEDGSSHHPVAREDGPDCIFFAVTAGGIDFV